MEALDVDVLVVGGGPAGSTISALLAKKGYKVIVLEKEQHPRFHIGESLLPCNMPIIEELGLMDRLREMGTVKLGADFALADDNEWRTYYFCNSLNKTPPNAFEVTRSEFDEMLFRSAGRAGADLRERVTMTALEWDEQGHATAKAVDHEGNKLTIKSRYFVDATGRDTFVSKKLGLKKKNKAHASAAIFGHFKGVERRAGKDQGNISIYWFDHGWMWMIPLKNDIVSVGAVCWPEYLKTRTGSTEDFLWQTLKLAPAAYARMKDATLLSEVRATGNYSYTSERMTGKGFIMVGDAFAFIDPVFSSGVYLAMNSAKAGAEVVDGILRDRNKEAELHAAYDQRVRKGITTFSWFIYRFTSPAMRWIFKNPRNIFRLEEGVVSMLAGDVFDSPAVAARFRMMRVLYGIRAVAELPGFVKNMLVRRKNAKTIFRGVTTKEGQPDQVGFS